MGYLSCNGEAAISTCDPYNWDCKRITTATAAKHGPGKPAKKIRKFSYCDLVKATGGFSAETFLGRGSHGNVYRAVLDDGKLVAAVKRTKLPSNPSATTTNANLNLIFNDGNNNNASPAENEIEILSRVHSPRLVNLIGFCDGVSDGRLHLVVEYMPNGSLYDLLHRSSRPPGWTRRIRFALQVAKAVQCLHSADPPVIHRDIKSSNVLIDGGSNARLGDFGLALRGHVEDVRARCTPPAGTLGYLDPGYLQPSDLSAKSDVFSFGILLLEIVSGRNAIDVNFSPPSIVDWAVPLIRRRAFDAIWDNRIDPPADPAAVRSVATLAARCVKGSARRRPEMAEVVEGLTEATRRARAWKNLNWGRRRVGASAGVDAAGGDETAKTMRRLGSGRKKSKVSSVPSVERGREGSGVASVEYKNEAIGSGDQVVRSRSVGSYSEIWAARRKPPPPPLRLSNHGVAVKRTVMAGLSKSRSMGVMQSRRVGYRDIQGSDKLTTSRDGEPEADSAFTKESEDSNESERKLLERPPPLL
ncbi:serine/threonine-protein kinase-like protein At1g28390 [Rhodamnia argentea]|uniref:Serine/threonine-protein kinase-like protein At1g28390 n=1 Tax=Rhodamnia argentea TaxID=178133 RepID=A0A8B8Q8W5_9MYRT|nr:serine/threonine-protein kinase-like protein At1g28390 [Rhodamnia argentea]